MSAEAACGIVDVEEKPSHYTLIPHEIIDASSTLTHVEFHLYYWYCRVCQRQGFCTQSLYSTCRMVRSSRNTIIAARNRLEELGLITTKRIKRPSGAVIEVEVVATKTFYSIGVKKKYSTSIPLALFADRSSGRTNSDAWRVEAVAI